MKETPPNPESRERITREQAMEAYRKFIDRGFTNPDDLDNNDPEVAEANELFYKWQAQEDSSSLEGADAAMRLGILKSMFYVDAGFTDPRYLEEVLDEWLSNDAQSAEKQSDNPERAKTREQIADSMKKIRAILGQQRKQ